MKRLTPWQKCRAERGGKDRRKSCGTSLTGADTLNHVNGLVAPQSLVPAVAAPSCAFNPTPSFPLALIPVPFHALLDKAHTLEYLRVHTQVAAFRSVPPHRDPSRPLFSTIYSPTLNSYSAPSSPAPLKALAIETSSTAEGIESCKSTSCALMGLS